MIIKRDKLFRVVCELRTESKDGINVGTGIFVNAQADGGKKLGWIVTAKHVAEKTSIGTQVVIATDRGGSASIALSFFGKIDSWKHHEIADVSVFPIDFHPENEKYLTNRFFPYDHFNVEHKSVSRDFELTTVGFPLGLGISGVFSPLTFRSYASSSFITFGYTKNGKKPEYFCLENPSVGGYSGAPVFDLGYSTNGVVTTAKDKTICHGIMKGTISDDTGGKIAVVTPAFYLEDLIERELTL